MAGYSGREVGGGQRECKYKMISSSPMYRPAQPVLAGLEVYAVPSLPLPTPAAEMAIYEHIP